MRPDWSRLRARAWQWAEPVRWAVAVRLPDWLVYWSVIRVWAYCTSGQYATTNACALTVAEALRRWGDKHTGGLESATGKIASTSRAVRRDRGR